MVRARNVADTQVGDCRTLSCERLATSGTNASAVMHIAVHACFAVCILGQSLPLHGITEDISSAVLNADAADSMRATPNCPPMTNISTSRSLQARLK